MGRKYKVDISNDIKDDLEKTDKEALEDALSRFPMDNSFSKPIKNNPFIRVAKIKDLVIKYRVFDKQSSSVMVQNFKRNCESLPS